MRHYIGGLIELCEEIEGNYMFEIRNWCPTRLTQVNRPQASHVLTHITLSIEICFAPPQAHNSPARQHTIGFGHALLAVSEWEV